MEQKLGRWSAIGFTLFASAAAWFLRRQLLLHAVDASGKVLSDANTGGLAWFCVAIVILFALYSFFLKPNPAHQAISGRTPAALLLTTVGALVMVAGRLAIAMELAQMRNLLLAAGGIVAAICWSVVGLARARGRRLTPMLFMVPALYTALELFCYFRDWSRDPQILDYCFDLLALISVMCATYYLGGFCFDKGKRRITVFFCCCGIFFSVAAMAANTLQSICVNGASVLWLLANLTILLRPFKERKSKED